MTFVLLAILLLSFALGATKCKKSAPSPDNGTLIQLYSQTQQRRTPASPLVTSLNGLSDQQLQWIDEGLQSLSADISANPNLNSHNIAPELSVIYALHTCGLSPESRTPSFLVRADDYDGTIYDQDPRPGIGMVWAAEYVITDAAPGTPWGYILANEWVICISDDPVYTRNAARFGNEHKFLFDWYPQRFQATVNHATGGHPIIGPSDDAAKLATVRPRDVVALAGAGNGRIRR